MIMLINTDDHSVTENPRLCVAEFAAKSDKRMLRSKNLNCLTCIKNTWHSKTWKDDTLGNSRDLKIALVVHKDSGHSGKR